MPASASGSSITLARRRLVRVRCTPACTPLCRCAGRAASCFERVRAILRRSSGTRILYGGSVSAKSAPDLAVKPDIGARACWLGLRALATPAGCRADLTLVFAADGFLVGNASLKAADFIDICKAGAIKANAHA